MKRASRHFQLCSSLALVIALEFIDAHSQSATPSQANFLRLERNGRVWQLRFTLADTNGAFRIMRSDHVQTLVSAGQVLAIVGAAGSPRTGVIDVPALTNSPAFFGLVGDQNRLCPPPPGMGNPPPDAVTSLLSWNLGAWDLNLWQ